MVLQHIQLLHLYSTEQCWPEMRKLPNKSRQVVASKLLIACFSLQWTPGPQRLVFRFYNLELQSKVIWNNSASRLRDTTAAHVCF